MVVATTPSCATLLAVACSPVTVPVDFVRNWDPQEWWQYVAGPLLLPLGLVIGPILTGMECDHGFLRNGHYGDPPITNVFEPVSNMPGH